MRYILLLFISSVSVLVNAQGELKILNKEFAPGDVIEFTYSNDTLTGFIKARALMIEPTYRLSTQIDIPINRTREGWQGEFTLIANCSGFFIAMEDEYGGTDGNAGEGYFFPLVDGLGNPVKGALAAKATQNYRTNQLGINPDSVEAIELFEQEFAKHPDLIPYYFASYHSYLEPDDSIGESRVLHWLDSLNHSRDLINDEDILWSVSIHYRIMKYRSKSDELKEYIMTRFPNGYLAITRRGGQLQMQTRFSGSLEEGLKNYDSLKEHYNNYLSVVGLEESFIDEKYDGLADQKKEQKISLVLGNYIFDMAAAHSNIVELYIEEGQFTEWKKEFLSFDHFQMQFFALSTFASISLFRHDYQKEAIEISNILESEAIRRLGTPRDFIERNRLRFTDSYVEEQRLTNLIEIKMSKADLYIDINKTKEAYKELMEIVSLSNLKFERYNLQVYQRLEKLDRTDEIAVLTGEVESRDLQKVKYEERIAIINGEEFSLDSVKYKNPRTLTANTGMRAPGFELEEESGKVVRLKDHKGKVIVLDFWATWCRPCLDVFPSLYELEKEYSDQEVVFFAINVDSRQSFKENIKRKFIDEKELDLKVLYDWDQETYTSYDVTALPTTIIVDTNGRIKFRKVGYDGNSTTYLQQMTELIEQSK